VLVLLVIAAGYGWWVTRDTAPRHELIPADQRLMVVVPRPVDQRDVVAGSRLWQALPEETGLRDLPQRLRADGGLPRWVLKNLMPDNLVIAAPSMERLDEVLVASRMSQLGAMLEWSHWVLPGIERDKAGGLNLRHVPDAGLYYAVRGRSLMVSPSRDALIRALTLMPGAAMEAPALAALMTTEGNPTLKGRIRLTPEDPAGEQLADVRFALRVEESEGLLACRSSLRPAFAERVAGLMQGLEPVELRRPPEGMLVVSANLGQTMEAAWAALGEAFPDAGVFGEDLWQDWTAWDGEEAPGFAPVATRLLGPMGPGVRLSLVQVNPYEILPMPELAATVDADEARIEAAYDSLPGAPADAMPWDSYPRIDADSRLLHLPMIGGPSLEPTAAPLGADTLLFCTSRVVGERLVDMPPEGDVLPAPGNVYVAVKPLALVEALVDCGAQFAEAGLIRGYDAAAYQAKTEGWLRSAARVEDVQVNMAAREGELEATLRIVAAETSQP
jgi:hypothetical protein